MNTNYSTDFQNRKVTKRQINEDLNEIRNTRVDYFKDEVERMNLLKEAGGVLYFTSEVVKAADSKDYNVTSWVFEIPKLMRFFYPDYNYCIIAGYLLYYHVRANLEREQNEPTASIEARPEPVGETPIQTEPVQQQEQE